MQGEWPYVVVAYGLTWIVLAGYLVYLHTRVKRAGQALEAERDTTEAH